VLKTNPGRICLLVNFVNEQWSITGEVFPHSDWKLLVLFCYWCTVFPLRPCHLLGLLQLSWQQAAVLADLIFAKMRIITGIQRSISVKSVALESPDSWTHVIVYTIVFNGHLNLTEQALTTFSSKKWLKLLKRQEVLSECIRFVCVTGHF